MHLPIVDRKNITTARGEVHQVPRVLLHEIHLAEIIPVGTMEMRTVRILLKIVKEQDPSTLLHLQEAVRTMEVAAEAALQVQGPDHHPVVVEVEAGINFKNPFYV
jgi:hypothetical protein